MSDFCLKKRPLFVVADNANLTTANAVETDFTWANVIGTMASSLVSATFTAPEAGKYDFRIRMAYEATAQYNQAGEGNLIVKLTQSNNTLIKLIRTGGVTIWDSGGTVSGSETIEHALDLTAGQTVKIRTLFTDLANGAGLYFYAAYCQLKISQLL